MHSKLFRADSHGRDPSHCKMPFLAKLNKTNHNGRCLVKKAGRFVDARDSSSVDTPFPSIFGFAKRKH